MKKKLQKHYLIIIFGLSTLTVIGFFSVRAVAREVKTSSVGGFHVTAPLQSQPDTSRDWGMFGNLENVGVDFIASGGFRWVPASNDTFPAPVATLDTKGNFNLIGNLTAADVVGSAGSFSSLDTGFLSVGESSLSSEKLALGIATIEIGSDASQRGAPAIVYNTTHGIWMLRHNNGLFSEIITKATDSSGGGGGGIAGPSSSTDNALVRFDDTTGSVLQNSGILVDDSNNMKLPLNSQLQYDSARLLHLTPDNSSLYIGYEAGNSSITGNRSIGIGHQVLLNQGSGSSNVAIGYQSLRSLQTGSSNVAIGDSALSSLGSSSDNVAIGVSAGVSMNVGNGQNVLIGRNAGLSLTDGFGNTLIGYGVNVASGGIDKSIALGIRSKTTANNQMVIGGDQFSTDGIFDLYIGNGVAFSSPNQITINATGGSGTDIAGANLALAGGKGTGSALGGSILFQTSDALASGTTLQTLATKMTLTSAGNLGIGIESPSQKLEIDGGVRLNTATERPSCDSTTRGLLWFTQGGAGVKDSLETCAKDAADVYDWRTLY